MFSLIITIISIALVAALAVATIYYGGSAFTKGSADAAASQLMNAAQQVNGAVVLYVNDHNGQKPASIADLVAGNYLTASPTLPGSATTNGVTNGSQWTVTGVSNDVCTSSKIQPPAACSSGTFTFPL
jgi:hypothetical protein